MDDDVLVRVENVSKRFCRSLKRSLWYGLQDLGSELGGRRHGGGKGLPQSSADVQLRLDEFWAVKDVSFELRRGECLGLIGRNGAGKTTLLKMLNGLIKPDGGSIEIRARVGALIALGAGFNPILTGRENIYVSGSVLGLSKQEIDDKIEDIINFAEIHEFIDAPVQNYSSGMAVRLGFSVAIETDPEILLLDEVLTVGDVAFQAKCFNAIASFRERGTGFILVSHNMHQITRYCDEVLCLSQGCTAHVGQTDIGVARFLDSMNSACERERVGLVDWTAVHGNGDIIFTGARFLNEDKKEIFEINVGDSVTLEIDFVSMADAAKDAVLDLVIRDHEGIVFQSVLRLGEQGPSGKPGKSKIDIYFPKMVANSSFLDFSFCSMNSFNKKIYDWKRNVRLKVNTRKNQSGRVLLEPVLTYVN